VAIRKDNVTAQVLLLSSGEGHEKNLPELMAIVKSLSPIKNLKTQDDGVALKSGVKLPAAILCEYFPVCDGYSYTYVENDPILGKVKHTKLYEKIPDKTVNGKKFKGFLVHCTNPFVDGRYEYYNFENGILSLHKENEEFTTNSYEEYNLFNPTERRTSYETQLVRNNSFTTSIMLKTNSPEGSSWSEKAINSGYVSTFKYIILEKGATVRAGAISYPNVIIVGQDIHTEIVATGKKVNVKVKMFFAKGVGLIKTITEDNQNEVNEILMETFEFD
jgi:hypothetical protein